MVSVPLRHWLSIQETWQSSMVPLKPHFEIHSVQFHVFQWYLFVFIIFFFSHRCQTLSKHRNAESLYGRDRHFSSVETKSTYKKTSKQQLSQIFLKKKSNENEDFTMQNGAMAEMSNASRSGSSQNAREEKLSVCQIESGLWSGCFCYWWQLLRITEMYFSPQTNQRNKSKKKSPVLV